MQTLHSTWPGGHTAGPPQCGSKGKGAGREGVGLGDVIDTLRKWSNTSKAPPPPPPPPLLPQVLALAEAEDDICPPGGKECACV